MVGSPDYIRRRGRPDAPRDLLGHEGIGRRYPSGAVLAWEFEKHGQTLDVAVEGSVMLDDAELMLAAAQAGLGFADVDERPAQAMMEAGRLVRVLEDWCPTIAGFFLYCPSSGFLGQLAA